jgi:hypothetical protein
LVVVVVDCAAAVEFVSVAGAEAASTVGAEAGLISPGTAVTEEVSAGVWFVEAVADDVSPAGAAAGVAATGASTVGAVAAAASAGAAAAGAASVEAAAGVVTGVVVAGAVCGVAAVKLWWWTAPPPSNLFPSPEQKQSQLWERKPVWFHSEPPSRKKCQQAFGSSKQWQMTFHQPESSPEWPPRELQQSEQWSSRVQQEP